MNFTRPFKAAIFFVLLIVQADFLSAQLTFQRTFQATGMNGGLSLSLTTDGGYVVTGQHGSSGEGLCDFYVYKRDACGNTDFFNTYGDSLSQGGKSVMQTSDGGFIVSGITQPYTGQETVLMKLNNVGTLQWIKNFGNATGDWGMDMQQTADGGYIITGGTVSPSPWTWDIFLIKLDGAGVTQWSKVFVAPGEEFTNEVCQTSDGGYFLTGYSRGSVNANDDLVAIKTDGSGNVQWSNVYGGTNNDGNARFDGLSLFSAAHGQQTPDGGYIIASNTRSFGVSDSLDIWLVKLDSGGGVQWNKTFGGTNNEEARSMDVTQDGGFAIVGWTSSFGFGEQDIYLLKTDSNGNLLWSKTYGGSAREKGESIRQSRIDKGYYIDGYSMSFTPNPSTDVFDAYAVKTDSLGLTGCSETSAATVTGSGTPVVTPFTFGLSTLPTRPSPVFYEHAFNPGEYALCEVLPPPDVAQFSATNVCQGVPTSFADASSAGYGVVTQWIWDFGDGSPFGTVQHPVHTYSASGTYSVTLVIHTTYSCIPDSLTQLVTVNPLPIANPVANNVCFNNVNAFTDTSTANNSIIQWNWNFGDLTPVSNSQSPTHTYASPGTYTVSLAITNNFGCKDTNSTVVVVNPIPAASFNATTLCSSDTVCFNNTSSITPSGLLTWSWNFGDPGSGANDTTTLQNPCHLFTGAGTFSVMLTAISDSGCPVTTPLTIIHPTVLTTTVSQTNTACNGVGSGILTINSLGGTPAFSYQWSNGQTAQTATGLATGTYSVLITDANGCTSTNSVAVTQPATLTSSVAQQTAILCNGGTGSASVTPSGGSPVYSYSWSNGQTTVSISGITAGNYSVTVTDASGCTSQASVTLVEPPLLTSSISGNDTICLGDNATLNAASIGGTPAYTYVWVPGPQNGSAVVINPSSTVSYTVSVTDANGCSSLVQTFNVVVVPSPTALFDTVSGGIYSANFAFSDMSSGGTGWMWDFGDGSSGSTQQNPIHTFPGSGTYTVTQVVFNEYGCPDTFLLVVKIDEGIIIPNVFTPDGDGVNDVWYVPNSGMKEYHVEIYDRWGLKVFETTAEDIRWDGHTSAGKVLSDGTYYYVLQAYLKSGYGVKDYSTKGYITLLTNNR